MWFKDILEKKGKILALAPMADFTDSPFCQIVKEIGGVDVVFREMVSSEAVFRGNEKTLKMLDFAEIERPIIMQIFGSDPKVMAKAARIIIDRYHPDGIDLNMGCPAHKIIGNFNGCALMKDPKLAAEIIFTVKEEVQNLPLSVKIRLGWSEPDEFIKFVPIIEKAGADLITLHARTKKQGYSGKADWGLIKQAKEITKVSLIANGDVHEPWQVKEVLDFTKADGVAIARGALGNPWFFKIANSENTTEKSLITFEERVQVILKHAKLHVERYGEKSIVTFRKHLLWYFKSNKLNEKIPNIKEFRVKLTKVNNFNELVEILKY